MTDKDRYIIYKMWMFIIQGVFLILAHLAKDIDGFHLAAGQKMFADDYAAFCNALGNPRSWDWIHHGSTSTTTSTSSDAGHSASSEVAP